MRTLQSPKLTWVKRWWYGSLIIWVAICVASIVGSADELAIELAKLCPDSARATARLAIQICYYAAVFLLLPFGVYEIARSYLMWFEEKLRTDENPSDSSRLSERD